MDAHYVRIHLRLRKGCIDVIDSLNDIFFTKPTTYSLWVKNSPKILHFAIFKALNTYN